MYYTELQAKDRLFLKKVPLLAKKWRELRHTRERELEISTERGKYNCSLSYLTNTKFFKKVPVLIIVLFTTVAIISLFHRVSVLSKRRLSVPYSISEVIFSWFLKVGLNLFSRCVFHLIIVCQIEGRQFFFKKNTSGQTTSCCGNANNP